MSGSASDSRPDQGGHVTDRSIDAAVHRLAAAQLQRFSRAQVRAEGGTDNHIAARLGSGLWLPDRFEGVYDLPGFADSFLALMWSAHLGLGDESVAAFEGAAHLHGLWGWTAGSHPLSFIVRHGDHHRLRGVEVHQIDDLFLFPEPGVRWMAQLLADFLRDDDLPAERWERKLFKLLRAAGEPLPVSQATIPGWNVPDACCDSLYIPAKLILEVDGRRWHVRQQDIKRDRQRDRAAATEEHQVLRYMVEEIRDDPPGVVNEIRAVRLKRERRFASQWGYMRAGDSMPSRSRPVSSVAAVSWQRRRRLARSSGLGAPSTEHVS